MFSKGINCISWFCFAAFVTTVMAASADVSANSGPDTIATSVQEMLRIDTNLALKKERQRELEASGIKAQVVSPLTSPLPQNIPETQSVEKQPASAEKKAALSLDGIFGIDNQLFADVMIDGVKVRYIKGQPYPVGFGKKFPYELIGIRVPCVSLKSKGVTEEVCIQGFSKE